MTTSSRALLITVRVQGDEPIVTGLDQTGPRVRFRSRVRISAGIGGRRRRFSDGFSSNASSTSGSTSSSISAPLRTHYTGSNGWGPLGSRMKLLASQTSPITACQDDDANGAGAKNGDSGDGYARRRSARLLHDGADEHTRLLTSATRHSYAGRYVHDSCNDDVSEREQERWWREQLVDEVFGRWPRRLFNRHWWWWHLEPIVCCLCEPEDE
ncbi:hypothetical protein JVT61DRAFT_9221 [Boletus reticuloceps]|uniref:Uncharacterized protein n=1 Tax=Boletus reticuloceps TaxID=495285 RepID=A0A8I2YGW5_9AGAM|nr:hypothetical protein JVT61DRAFT_9221 [Boletus reticuloceps]